MYKDNAVGNVVPETGRDIVFMITARLSDLSMPLKGEVRRSPVQSARQPIARSGKFVRRAYSRRALDCEKDDGLTCMYAFSHRDHGAHFCWGKRGDLMWHPAVKHQRPAAKTTNSNCCDSAAAQVKQHISTYPNNRVEKTASTEQISKRGFKLILKTIEYRKGGCAWSCSRWQTQPEKIWNLQSTNQYNMRSEWHWFMRCDLQIFSGCVCHLEQLHAHSPFLFPIVFSIIESAEALPILCVRYNRWERERERERRK